MTRPIDADALERAIYEWMPKDQEAWMGSDIPPIENLVVSIMMTIQEQPTVDAIPISFIKGLIDLSRKVGADHHAESLEILLADWAERKEENGK